MGAVEKVEAVFGGDLQTELTNKLGEASTALDNIASEMAKAKDEDTQRWNELNDERKAQAGVIEQLKKDQEAAIRDADTKAAIEAAAEMKAFLAGQSMPSKARQIGGNYIGGGRGADTAPREGEWLKAIMDAGNVGEAQFHGVPEATRQAAREQLKAWGASRSEYDPSKATLGSTDATGGWILPNATVDDLIKVGRYSSPILGLVTVRRGLNVTAIDIPYRRVAATASVAIAWGNTKTNADVAYNGYTATMYTLASIYDISRQFAMKSAGAAEQDVRQELDEALTRGVATYIYQGTGSSQPFGLNAALVTSPPFAPTTTSSHTAATTTVAGNIATAISVAAGALESRNRRAEAAIVAPVAYWQCVSAGDDDAGFYISPAAGAPGFNAVAQVNFWGIPIFREPEYLTGTDDMILGEFSALKVYFGDGPRFDSSDVAGERWDKNLIGFRGELEMAFDARPAVYAGALQFVADIVT